MMSHHFDFFVKVKLVSTVVHINAITLIWLLLPT